MRLAADHSRPDPVSSELPKRHTVDTQSTHNRNPLVTHTRLCLACVIIALSLGCEWVTPGRPPRRAPSPGLEPSSSFASVRGPELFARGQLPGSSGPRNRNRYSGRQELIAGIAAPDQPRIQAITITTRDSEGVTLGSYGCRFGLRAGRRHVNPVWGIFANDSVDALELATCTNHAAGFVQFVKSRRQGSSS